MDVRIFLAPMWGVSPLALLRYTLPMSWLSEHPWVQRGRSMGVDITVYRVGPYRVVTLPDDDPPEDLVDEVRARVNFVPGKSASVAALEAELPPAEGDLLAVVGKKAGLWGLWPDPNNTLWSLGAEGQFPILTST